MGGDYSGSNHAVSVSDCDLKSEGFNLDGGTNRFVIPHSADWDLGSGDFTIEFFGAQFSSVSTFQYIISQLQTTGAQETWLWRLRGDLSPKRVQFLYSTTGSGTSLLEINWAPSAATEYDIAMVRDGGTLRFYVDGVQQGTAAISGAIFDGSSDLWIGASPHAGTSANLWVGRFRACRITKGVARYPSGATYTVPSLPLPTS